MSCLTQTARHTAKAILPQAAGSSTTLRTASPAEVR